MENIKLEGCEHCEGSGIRRPANLFDDYDTEFCDCPAGNPQKLLNKNEETVLLCPNCGEIEVMEQKIWAFDNSHDTIYTGSWFCGNPDCDRNFQEVNGQLVAESETDHWSRVHDHIKENDEFLKAAQGL